MKKWCVNGFPVFFLLCLTVDVVAQPVMGARGIAMGQAVTGMPNSGWAVFNNPAMMPDSSSDVAFYAMRYYGLKVLTDYSASMSLHTDIGTIGAGAHTYGYKLFRKSRFRIAYKWQIGRFRMGLAVNYSEIVIPSPYGSAGSTGIDAGLGVRLWPGGWLGADAVNINRPKLGKSKEELPRNLSAGISSSLFGRGIISVEVYKDISFPVSIRAGLEMDPVRIFRIRGGITTKPQTFSVGIGLVTSFWNIDITVQKHRWLGWSPGAGMTLHW